MRLSSRSAAALGASAAVALAGCGGGSDFTSQANDICKKYQAKVNAIPKPNDASGVGSYLAQSIPVLAEGIAKLKAVKPPSDKKSAYEEFLAGLDQQMAAIQRADSTAKAGDVKGATTFLQQQSSLSQQINAKADAAGLKECSK